MPVPGLEALAVVGVAESEAADEGRVVVLDDHGVLRQVGAAVADAIEAVVEHGDLDRLDAGDALVVRHQPEPSPHLRGVGHARRGRPTAGHRRPRARPLGLGPRGPATGQEGEQAGGRSPAHQDPPTRADGPGKREIAGPIPAGVPSGAFPAPVLCLGRRAVHVMHPTSRGIYQHPPR